MKIITAFLRPALRLSLLALLALPLVPALAQPVDTGGIARNFTLRNRATGEPVSLHDFAGHIVVLDFFAYWCPPCQTSSPELEQNVHRYYAARGGNANGIPVQVIGVNIESANPSLTDQFVRQVGANLAVDDLQLQAYGQFLVGQNAIPRFVIINGTAGSTTHRQWEVVLNTIGWGGNNNTTSFRRLIDNVQTVRSPTMTVQPQSQHVSPGASVTFNAAANGTGLGFQWRKDGVAIAGATGSTFAVTSASARDMGFYTVAVSNAGGTTESTAATLTIATDGTSRPVNLSTRGLVPAGGDLTPGFVIAGTGNKWLLVRAIGPGLAAFGITDYLADPQLEIIPQAGAAVAANNDWAAAGIDNAELSAAAAGVGAFPLVAGSRDAAALVSLAPGGYTVRVTGVGGVSGLALVEIYDVDLAGSSSRLVNLSARAFVGTGAAELVPGFVVHGAAPRQLLIRAVGPSLAQFGVTELLADPQLAVIPLGRNFSVANCNDWGGATPLRAAFASAGAFTLSNNTTDAAIVVRLPPGAYTVAVSGVGRTTGTALVEIYDLDP
ncbi:MAG: redoxin domain-containing protein [Opitutaceae bacterium]|nr:redoxin domain-containing protein [Opitutaceae bacterium]